MRRNFKSCKSSFMCLLCLFIVSLMIGCEGGILFDGQLLRSLHQSLSTISIDQIRKTINEKRDIAIVHVPPIQPQKDVSYSDIATTFKRVANTEQVDYVYLEEQSESAVIDTLKEFYKALVIVRTDIEIWGRNDPRATKKRVQGTVPGAKVEGTKKNYKVVGTTEKIIYDEYRIGESVTTTKVVDLETLTEVFRDTKKDEYYYWDVISSTYSGKIDQTIEFVIPVSTSRFQQPALLCKEILKEKYQYPSSPSNLEIAVTFSDDYNQNRILEAGESAKLALKISNLGPEVGPAYDTQVIVHCDVLSIQIESQKSIGDIKHGESVDVSIPLTADLNILDGKATITIQAKEKRGYDAKPVQVTIPVKGLEAPKLAITRVDVNDANLGQAKGNGNGIPENGETIELLVSIQNSGVGTAFGSTLKLVETSSGVNMLSDQIELGAIEANTITKAKVVIEIPRTYAKNQLDYALRVTEVRNACPPAEKRGMYEINHLTPLLAYDFTPPGDLRNGGSGAITLIPKNEGTLAASGVQLSLKTDAAGVILENNRVNLGTLAPKAAAQPQSVIIQVPRTYTQPEIPVQISITQDGFTEIKETKRIPVHIAIPQLQLVDQSNLRQQAMQGMSSAELILAVRNNGDIAAEDVQVSLSNSIELIAFHRDTAGIGKLPSGSISDPEKFIFQVPGGVQPGTFPIQVTISQKDFPPITETLNYQILAWKPQEFEITPPEEPGRPAIPPGHVNQPPEIQIVEISDGQTLYTNHLSFIASVSDNTGVASVKGRLNGTLFYDSQTEGGSNRSNTLLTIQKELTGFHQGENILEIVAEDLDHLSQIRKLTLYYDPTVENIVKLSDPSDVDVNLPQGQANPDAAALIIGIQNYQNIPEALYADRDAIAFYHYCLTTLGIKENNIELLLNEKATLAGIKKSLRQLYNLGPQIRKVFIFYSGHGFPSLEQEPYLIPYDGDPDPTFLADTCFPLDSLYEGLDNLPAKDIVMFLDACFSGEDRMARPLLPSAKISSASIKYGKKEYELLDQGIVTEIASSMGNQISWSYDEKRHGLFTYYLLKALQDGAIQQNNSLTIGDLYTYLEQRIRTTTSRLKKAQTPVIRGRDVNKIIVRY